MKILALIQARMGSTRLPGKVLSPILAKPMLEWQLERLARSKHITQIIVATSTLPIDDPIADFCKSKNFHFFRGSEDNVLDRFYQASCEALATEERADAIVLRLTGDCPLLDPSAIDEGIEQFLSLQKKGCRYFGYDGDLPDGMDFEIFSWHALDEAHRLAQDSFEKEHVTPFMWRNPEKFGLQKYTKKGITPGLRFSVDYQEDLNLVTEVLTREKNTGKIFGMREISELLSNDPTLCALNAKIIKNEGLLITALKSDPYKTLIDGKRRTKYGVHIAEVQTNTLELIQWANRIGIDLWTCEKAQESLLREHLNDTATINRSTPANWGTFFDDSNDWQATLFQLHNDSTLDGIVLHANSRGRLAELLMFLCLGRFSYKSTR